MNSKPSPEPLSESTYLILMSLVKTPKHGYAIMQDVASLSDERVNLSTGTLYGALNRMLENNWVEVTNDPETASRGRKTYRLTATGQSILDAEIHRLKQLVALADLKTAEDEA